MGQVECTMSRKGHGADHDDDDKEHAEQRQAAATGTATATAHKSTSSGRKKGSGGGGGAAKRKGSGARRPSNSKSNNSHGSGGSGGGGSSDGATTAEGARLDSTPTPAPLPPLPLPLSERSGEKAATGSAGRPLFLAGGSTSGSLAQSQSSSLSPPASSPTAPSSSSSVASGTTLSFGASPAARSPSTPSPSAAVSPSSSSPSASSPSGGRKPIVFGPRSASASHPSSSTPTAPVRLSPSLTPPATTSTSTSTSTMTPTSATPAVATTSPPVAAPAVVAVVRPPAPDCLKPGLPYLAELANQSVAAIYAAVNLDEKQWDSKSKPHRKLTTSCRAAGKDDMFKGETVMKGYTPKQVFEALRIPARQSWDKGMKRLESLYVVDDQMQIVRSLSQPQGPVSSRDFIDLLMARAEPAADTYVMAVRALPSHYADCWKPPDGSVRAFNYPGGVLITPEENGASARVVFVVHNDLSLSLPNWLLRNGMKDTLCKMYINLVGYLAATYGNK